jgi:hypothetical protein
MHIIHTEPTSMYKQLALNHVKGTFYKTPPPHTPLPEQLFTKMPEVNNIFSAFPKIILDVESLDAIATILGKLKTAQINFSAFTVKTANLEDVYLQLTGHEFEE